jgi:hypothetical protein
MKKPILALALVVWSLMLLNPNQVMAQSGCTIGNGGIRDGVMCVRPSDVPANLFGEGSIFQAIANVLIFLVGAVAVLMLIVGGLRYVLSSGNSSAVESAKNTILYAIVGIVVAIMAFAAVNFVISRLVP